MIRLATRRSALARAQAGLIADALMHEGEDEVVIVPLATTGDEHPERALQAFDSKGLFVDRIREAVLEGRADAAVHSHKDLPTDPVDGLVTAALPRREDPRDVLVTRDGRRLASLARGATVGTSSLRRGAQLQRARRDLLVQPLRGNLDTRVRRVADGHLDAVVVAAAGLLRLGLELAVRIVALEHGECLHAPAQGALAVECRADDAATRTLLARIDDPTTRQCVAAERSLLRALEGGCAAPIGAHAELDPDGGRLELLGMLADPSGTRMVRASAQSAPADAEELGIELAQSLRDRGGEEILARLRRGVTEAPIEAP